MRIEMLEHKRKLTGLRASTALRFVGKIFCEESEKWREDHSEKAGKSVAEMRRWLKSIPRPLGWWPASYWVLHPRYVSRSWIDFFFLSVVR